MAFSADKTVRYRRHPAAATSKGVMIAKACLTCLEKHVPGAEGRMRSLLLAARHRETCKLSSLLAGEGNRDAVRIAMGAIGMAPWRPAGWWNLARTLKRLAMGGARCSQCP